MPLNPDHATLWQQAATQFESRQYTVAAASCQQLIALAPEKPMAYALLSRICHQQGLTRPAMFNAFQASRRVAGAHWKDIIAISAALLEVGANVLAHSVLSFINPHDPANRDGLLGLGRQYSGLNDQPRALYCIELAKANGCDSWFVSHMHGTVLSITGPLEHAIAACEDCVAKHPKHGHGHWSRAQFGLKDGAQNRVLRMRQVLTEPGLGNDDVTFLQYGLFKELDTLDQRDDAWTALMAGAKVRRNVSDYNVERENAGFDALIDATPKSFTGQCGDASTDAMPIFIVGMPRTGTTLLERILGNHPQIATGGEINDFRQQMQWVNNRRLPTDLDASIGDFVSRLDYTLLGRRYLEKTDWLRAGKPFYSDRHPLNFMYVGMILKALPHAKIVHLRRHPMDACFSTLKELFAKGAYSYSYALDELANHYRNYVRLMQHWRNLWPGRILDVRYEDLVGHPEQQARCVQDYLGLPAAEGVTSTMANTRIATTASSLQLRQPIHTRYIAGWRRYQHGLAPLQALLADCIGDYEAGATAIQPKPLRVPVHM